MSGASVAPPPSGATFDLSGRVAIVTGAAQGLGADVADLIASSGARGLLLTDVQGDKGRQFSTELNEKYPKGTVVFIEAQLSDPVACTAIIDACEASFGTVLCLVNVAGVTHRGSLESTSVELWDTIMHVNLRAPFLLTQGASRLMKKNQVKGSIVNIGSVQSWGGLTFCMPYACSKVALGGLSKNNAQELLPFGIRVNMVNPGWMLTENEDKLQKQESGEDWLAKAEQGYPLRRLLKPRDVSVAVCYLLSDASAMMTGSTIDIHPELILGMTSAAVGKVE